MEQPTQNQFILNETALTVRVGSVSIFTSVVLVFLFFPGITPLVPIVSFFIMVFVILFAANIRVYADRAMRTLTVEKKRIIGSTVAVYAYDDIVYILRNTSVSVISNGQQQKRIEYSLALKGKTSSLQVGGYIPIPLAIPVSGFTMFSSLGRDMQKFTHAKSLANFIGVPLYEHGGENDTLVNTIEAAPQVIKTIQNLPAILAEAKRQNDEAAREILGDKYPKK